MQVFKFGGASVRNAENIKNAASIISHYRTGDLLVIVSAIDKTTNRLEEVTNAYFHQNGDPMQLLAAIKGYHLEILQYLCPYGNVAAIDYILYCFVEIEWVLEEDPKDSYDFLFDQIVSVGELLSSKLLAAYCKS